MKELLGAIKDCSEDSRRWTPGKIFLHWVWWKLYALRPSKRSVEFNLPGPTSSTHKFGWITPPRRRTTAG